MSRQPVALIAAGGTGGHVFPALAVAHELSARGFRIEWLGAPKGIETRVVPANQFPLHLISVSGLRGKGIKRLLLAPFMLLKAVSEAAAIIGKLRPNVVLGMGGFASGPGCLMARLRGVPVVIHEQNAIPGLTNSLLARIATRILEGFENAFANKRIAGAEYTGNPVRRDIIDCSDAEKHPSKPQLLLIGGSLGAVALNDMLPLALAQIPLAQRPVVWHQCGRGRSEAVAGEYQRLGVDAKVSDFIDDMAAAYAWADMAICRAGAMTVSELAVAGVPAIFIPYPYAVDDHQSHNARWLVARDGAVMLPQQELTANTLAQQIQALLAQPDQLQAMAAAARSAGKREATVRVASICEEVARG